MAAIGHPIVGDATYSNINHNNFSNKNNNRRTTCMRMCLHARRLSIPIEGEVSLRTFVAKDPFVIIDSDNEAESSLYINERGI